MSKNQRPIYINITAWAIVKIILVFILFYLLYLAREILAVLFVSLILSSALGPWVDWMQKRKIPRSLGITLIYLILFIVIGGVIYLMIPPIEEQVRGLIANFPAIFEKITSSWSALEEYSAQHGIFYNSKGYFSTLGPELQNAAGGVFSTVANIFGGIVSFFLVLVITFYMLVEENALKKIVWSVTPPPYQVYVIKLVSKMQKKVGLWLRGQLILSLIIFTLTYTGLKLFNLFGMHIEYALVLALIAGLTEFIPYLGPTIASIPAILLALIQNPILALFVAILYYCIQWSENHIIVPMLMKKVVGLNPIVSISALLIGFKIAGLIGAVLAMPVATAAGVLLFEICNPSSEESGAGDDKQKF